MKASYKCINSKQEICFVEANSEETIEEIKKKGKEQLGIDIIEVLEENRLEGHYKCGGNWSSRKKIGFIKRGVCV